MAAKSESHVSKRGTATRLSGEPLVSSKVFDKKPKLDVVKTSSEHTMEIDTSTKDPVFETDAWKQNAEDDSTFFVFEGFVGQSSDVDIVQCIHHFTSNFLDDFPIVIIGVHAKRVAVRIPRLLTAKFEEKIHTLRDKLIFKDTALSMTSLDPLVVELFVRIPIERNAWNAYTPVTNGAQPGSSSNVPAVESKYAILQAKISTPMRSTMRSEQGIHSGFTPELNSMQQATAEVLARERMPMQPLAQVPALPNGDVPANEASLHSMLSSLVSGMNEVRATLSNVVTRDDLRALHEVQTAEMHTYVQAELAPVHSGIAELAGDFRTLASGSIEQHQRIGRMETTLQAMPSSGLPNGPDKNHSANCQISFSGFSNESVSDRARTLREFMRAHFEPDSYLCIGTRMTGPFGDGRHASAESFVQFCHRDAKDAALKFIVNGKFKVSSSAGKTLNISRMKTPWQRRRDYAMGKAEELVKKKMEANSWQGVVKFTKSKEVRKICVNDSDAFIQAHSDECGNFVGDFIDLRIP